MAFLAPGFNLTQQEFPHGLPTGCQGSKKLGYHSLLSKAHWQS